MQSGFHFVTLAGEEEGGREGGWRSFVSATGDIALTRRDFD